MNSRFIAILSLLLVSACAVTPQGGTTNAEFHMPLTYEPWKTQYYTMQSGTKACTISSGYNGLSVKLSERGGKVVESNRIIAPGSSLTVSVDGRNFVTSDAFFPQATVDAIIAALTKGGKAYLEWSESSRTGGGASIHVQNVVALEGFSSQLQQCRTALKL